MSKQLLSGNEAIARGAWEAGVAVGAAYPGTPSTETLENLVTMDDVYCEWAPNEKVALEVGLGAAMGGVRSLVTMKHVGVNVAADPLMSAANTGVNATSRKPRPSRESQGRDAARVGKVGVS